MPNTETQAKRYPVKFAAPALVNMPATSPNEGATSEARELKTYVKDWLTVEEFNYLMPEHDIVKFMCYEAVGPESWTINLHASDVLSCESRRAVQTIYVNAVRNVYLGKDQETPEKIEKIARGYGEISPDAVLFLMRLHEYLNDPEDNFEAPQAPDEETLSKAVEMMINNDVALHHLTKNDNTEVITVPK